MFNFGQNGENRSVIARAVFGSSGGHSIDEATDYDRRTRKTVEEKLPEPTECVLRSSSEEHWVSHFASVCLERAKKIHVNLTFHNFCEIPSKPSEKLTAAGYDLSLGPYDNKVVRLRTMHKTTPRQWCDLPWTVPFKTEDVAHLKSLALSQHPFFIVVHAFHCIHDWRRMGEVALPSDTNQLNSAVTVPSFEGVLRTIIFDMQSIRDFIAGTKIDRFKIKHSVSKKLKENHAEHLANIEEKKNFRIFVNNKIVMMEDEEFQPITMAAFLSMIEGSCNKEWSNSKFSNK